MKINKTVFKATCPSPPSLPNLLMRMPQFLPIFFFVFLFFFFYLQSADKTKPRRLVPMRDFNLAQPHSHNKEQQRKGQYKKVKGSATSASAAQNS